MKTIGLLSATAAALFWLLTPGPAGSEERPGLFQGWGQLSAAELAVERGGESTVPGTINLTDMGADVRDNTVVNSNSGDNLVGGGAFAGAGGFSTVIQNSTIVNLTIEK